MSLIRMLPASHPLQPARSAEQRGTLERGSADAEEINRGSLPEIRSSKEALLKQTPSIKSSFSFQRPRGPKKPPQTAV